MRPIESGAKDLICVFVCEIARFREQIFAMQSTQLSIVADSDDDYDGFGSIR